MVLIEHSTNTTVTHTAFTGTGNTETVDLYEVGIPMTNIEVYLPLDGDVIDYSGNKVVITNNGATVSSGLRGKSSYNFVSASTDSIDIGYGNTFNPFTSAISVSLWVYWNGGDSDACLGVNVGTNQRFYLGAISSKWDMGIQNSGWGTGGAVTTATSATWTHLVIVMNAGVASMYVDGVSSFSKNYTSYAFTSDIDIGRIGTTGLYWDGKIQDVRVYTQVLTLSEINTLYKMFDPTEMHQIQFNNDGSMNVFGEVKEI